MVGELTDGNVYLGGGSLVRQFLDEGLVNELTVTLIPVVLGAGSPLFAGARRRHRHRLLSSRAFAGGIVQLVYRATADREGAARELHTIGHTSSRSREAPDPVVARSVSER